MKPILLNSGAGYDAMALARALCDRKIAGADIDVLESESPSPQDHPLLHAPNTLITLYVA